MLNGANDCVATTMVPTAKAAWSPDLTGGSIAIIIAVEPLGLVVNGPMEPCVLCCIEWDKLQRIALGEPAEGHTGRLGVNFIRQP